MTMSKIADACQEAEKVYETKLTELCLKIQSLEQELEVANHGCMEVEEALKFEISHYVALLPGEKMEQMDNCPIDNAGIQSHSHAPACPQPDGVAIPDAMEPEQVLPQTAGQQSNHSPSHYSWSQDHAPAGHPSDNVLFPNVEVVHQAAAPLGHFYSSNAVGQQLNNITGPNTNGPKIVPQQVDLDLDTVGDNGSTGFVQHHMESLQLMVPWQAIPQALPPFSIVPPEEEISELVNYMKRATLSVRDKDNGTFNFYQPPLDCPIHIMESLPGSQLTQKDLGTLLLIPFTVGKMFQEKGANCRFNIDVIVRVDSGGTCKFSVHSDGALPDFIEQLEQELHLQCSPGHDMTILPLLASVKAHLGDDTFDEHFTDVNDGSETHHITDIELLHYLNALIDQHLSNQAAYRNRTSSHVYSLLRRFAVNPLSKSPCSTKLFFDALWVFGLAMKTRDNQILHQYTPCSDVFLSIKGFLHVLLEISSDKQKKGTNKSPTFFMKAFYINNDYHVEEFTLYQRHHKSGPGDDKLTPQMGGILSSILTETKGFPYVMAWREHGAKDGASSSFKWRNQQSTQESISSSTTGTSVQSTIMVQNQSAP
ncbi:hypothetical protein EDB89DRAFT_1907738 [Lactarius sanguifluus]|nr:hypothetical protein EDB89DRAFT_1907738 [Lactarius sanguifluus]